MNSPTASHIAIHESPPTSTTLQQLTSHVARLHSLLQDPEPGLITWVSMVSYEWNAITELGTPPRASAPSPSRGVPQPLFDYGNI